MENINAILRASDLKYALGSFLKDVQIIVYLIAFFCQFQLTVLILAVQATVFVWKVPVFAARGGAAQCATQWITRPDNVCLIARVTETSIWRPKSASVSDNGREMTAPKVNIDFFITSDA